MTYIDRMAGSIWQPVPLTNWVNIPAVLVAGATATQNHPFSSLTVVVVTIASTRCAYPRRDGQAELAWVAGYVMRQFTCPKAVTHPNTNRAQCWSRPTRYRYTKPPPCIGGGMRFTALPSSWTVFHEHDTTLRGADRRGLRGSWP